MKTIFTNNTIRGKSAVILKADVVKVSDSGKAFLVSDGQEEHWIPSSVGRCTTNGITVLEWFWRKLTNK